MPGEELYSADQVLSQVLDDAANRLKVAVGVETVNVAAGHKNEDSVVGSVSVPAGAGFTTVLSFTPVADKMITDFNADIGAIVSQNFRVRLRVNAVTKMTEALVSTGQGMIHFPIKLLTGIVAEVQVSHAEVTAQTYEASIAFRDL